MYRAKLAKTVGEYDPDMFLAEDYDYWLRLFAKAPMVTIHECLYQYRVHKGSLTATRYDEIMNQNARLWMKYFDILVPLIPSYKERKVFFDTILLSAAEAERSKFENALCRKSVRYHLYRQRKKLMRTIRKHFQ
jgi:hypothetical protein